MTVTDLSIEERPEWAAVGMWMAEQSPRDPDTLRALAAQAVWAVEQDARTDSPSQGDHQLAYAYAVGRLTHAEVRAADAAGTINEFNVITSIDAVVHAERDRRQSIRLRQAHLFDRWRINRYYNEVGAPAELGLVIAQWEERSRPPFEGDSYAITAGVTAQMATLSQLFQERLVLRNEDAAQFLPQLNSISSLQ